MLSARDRRAVTLGLGALLLAATVLRGAPALGGRVGRLHAETMQQAELLARLEHEAETGPALLARGEQLRARLTALAPHLVGGATEAEASATLDLELRRVARRSSVLLIRAQPLADSATAGELKRVSLALSLESDLAGFAGLLRSLRAGAWALDVDELHLAVAPETNAGGAERLTGELRVRGWYLARGSAP